MKWDNPQDDEPTQKLKNQAYLRLSLTNKQRDKAMPYLAIMLALAVIGGVVGALLTSQ
jgi:hypothetical protein